MTKQQDTVVPVAEGLVEVPPHTLDNRCEDEIVSALTRFQPVESERNVWAFWDQGFDKMKPLMRQNVINWVQRLGPSWTVRVTDLVPGSPNHVLVYTPIDYFPWAFIENRIDGNQKGQHASDLARLPLIIEVSNVLTFTRIRC